MYARTRSTEGTRLRLWATGYTPRGDTIEELRAMVKDAVRCYFDETMEAPKIIRLHFVREEILAA